MQRDIGECNEGEMNERKKRAGKGNKGGTEEGKAENFVPVMPEQA